MSWEHTPPLYTAERTVWRAWLAENFEREREVWLLYPKKASGRKRIVYNDAVEEALCFGWIDSTYKRFDEQSGAQRFTPRNPKSSYSQSNIERLRALAKAGMLHPRIHTAVQAVIARPFVFPHDIMTAIKDDAAAWEYYQTVSPTYQRIRIAYIDAARDRPQEFVKRLKNFLNKTRAHTLIIGYGGIEKYYTK